MAAQLFELIWMVDKRLTVVSERQRDEPAASQQASYDAEE